MTRRDFLRGAVLALCLAFPAAAEEAPEKTAPKKVKTGKERLTGKWADEQRVNDCKVPPERRTKKRPAECGKAATP